MTFGTFIGWIFNVVVVVVLVACCIAVLHLVYDNGLPSSLGELAMLIAVSFVPIAILRVVAEGFIGEYRDLIWRIKHK